MNSEDKHRPYSRKTAVAIGELRKFRAIGEKFNYMGIEMIVESHVDMVKYIGFIPYLTAAYKNNNGELKHAYFKYSELPALIAENS